MHALLRDRGQWRLALLRGCRQFAARRGGPRSPLEPPPPAVAQPLAAGRALSAALGGEALVVTREIEWGNLVFGFEQANRYNVYDEKGSLVALLAEETPSVVSAIGRQLLHRHRGFTASVLDPHSGSLLFRVRRPMYVVESNMFIEDAEGTTLGEVRQRWHLWKRNYDLYRGDAQFAEIRSGLLAWEFTLVDEGGEPLAHIDRNFRGFGMELFTDAGKYAIHFGKALKGTKAERQQLAARSGAPETEALTAYHDPVAMQIRKPLPVSDRMIALAAAISIDFDLFSRHSGGHGGMPFFFPFGWGGGGAEGGEAEPAGPATPETPEPAGAGGNRTEELDSGEGGGWFTWDDEDDGDDDDQDGDDGDGGGFNFDFSDFLPDDT